MQIHVEVQQEDIDQGCKSDTDGTHGGCMVWRAFMRSTEGAFDGINVESSEIESWGENEKGVFDLLWCTDLPDRVEKRIYAFDTGKPVKPFAFDLDLPIEAPGEKE